MNAPTEKRATPHIFIIYTGGTIGMEKVDGGYRPSPGYLERIMANDERFLSDLLPRFTIKEFHPLLDSADMTPSDWLRIAEVIRDNYNNYDGFLVLHGTDTMAYTASALSFMLENLQKPVVLTGAQIPLFEVRNDAEENLVTALMLLGEYYDRLGEVFIYFSGALFRGNRCTKVNADDFNAFDSPNYPKVAEVGVNIEINLKRVIPPKQTEKLVEVVAIGKAVVAAVRLFPGIKSSYLTNILAAPMQGVVLECFGSGNAPSRDSELIEALAKAVERGVVIVAVTQPLRGYADLNRYETGRILADIGVVSGMDMTTEAALAKLFYLFEKGYSPKKAKEKISQNLRGELTGDESTREG